MSASWQFLAWRNISKTFPLIRAYKKEVILRDQLIRSERLLQPQLSLMFESKIVKLLYIEIVKIVSMIYRHPQPAKSNTV